MRKIFVAVILSVCVLSLCAGSSSAARVRTEKSTYFIEDAEGSAVIRNGNTKQAREEAKRSASRDAIDKAMEMFAGSVGADMRNKVLAKSQSLVRNFRITSETVSGDTLYITGSCSVGEKAFDGVLGPEVISMLGNPRVMIIVDSASGKNASTVESELLSLFEKAGYLIVDNEQAKTLLALDSTNSFSDEQLAGAAKTLKADIIIVAHATSGAAHAQRFGIHMYKPSGSVQLKAVLTKTAYQISSSTVSRGTKDWQGSSSAAGLIRSGLRQAAEEIIYKIAYKMASAGSLGGTTVNITLADASFKDVEKLTEYLRGTGQVFERSYSKKLTELDLVSPKTARNVASLISDYTLPGGVIEVEGLTAQTVSARVKPLTPEKPAAAPAAAPEVKYVVINIYLEKLYENEADRVRTELKDFIGSAGEIEENFRDSKLLVNIKFAQDSQDAKNVYELESFLRDEMKRKGVTLIVDKSDGNSIRGSGDHLLFFGN